MSTPRSILRWVSPPFFVCEWHTVGDRDVISMSGEFACLGDTREDAEADACRVIERHLLSGMRATATVRRASLWERFAAAPISRGLTW